MSNLLYNSTRLIDAIQASSSFQIASSASVIPKYQFGPTSLFDFTENFEYYLSFNAFCEKLASFDGRMDVYLSGSAFPSYDRLGYQLGSLISPANSLIKNFNLQEFEFLALATGTAKLVFVIYSGLWYVSNITFQLADWFGFNPDQSTIQLPLDGYRYRTLVFKAELYDINNNVIPSNNFTVISGPIFITGSNTVIQGTNNNIAGTLTVAPSGSGVVLGSNPSGSFIGIVGGQNSSSLPQPINPSQLPSYVGPPIITIYSGSLPYSGSNTPGTSSMGIQIAAGTISGSFLDYNVLTGTLVIRGDIQLLPSTSLSSSIQSGSGQLALSEIQALVNATGPNLPVGTYLNGNFIFSPIIAGNSGFFNTQFGVGNLVAGKGIVLTALGYTGSNGSPVSGASAIYIGQGTVNNTNTAFIVASGTQGPVFSLANLLSLSPTGSNYTLNISASNFLINTNTITIDTFNNSGTILLGDAISFDNGIGSYIDGTGLFRVGDPSGSYLSFNGMSVIIAGTNVNLFARGRQAGFVTGNVSGTSAIDPIHVTFNPSFITVPTVILDDSGISFQPNPFKWSSLSYTTASAQYDDLTAINVTTSGFDLRARLRQKGSAATPVNDPMEKKILQTVNAFATGTLSTAATNDTYTILYDLSARLVTFTGNTINGSITLNFDSDVTGVWQTYATTTYPLNGVSTYSQSFLNQRQSVSVSGETTGDHFRILVAAFDPGQGDSGGQFAVTAHSMSYNTSTSDVFTSKIPDSDDVINWQAFEVS